MKPRGKVVFHPGIEKYSDYMHEKAVSQQKISSPSWVLGCWDENITMSLQTLK